MPATIKATEPKIPWRDLGGLQNVIAHGYLGIDIEVVWLVIERDLPPLTEAVNRMARHLSRPN